MLFETPTVAGLGAGNVVSPARVERTPVTHLFFHPQNIEALHTSIRYEVYRRTRMVIDRQGDNQLRIIMTAVYGDSQDPTLESAVHGATVSAIVHALNGRVLHRAVHEIVNAMGMHRFYLNDLATPVPVPLERGAFADESKGLKTLELPIGF